jgi:2-polyprenyl-3-methyl-5-hydroxy-6-metoxy-1,4-benzoquinol methylase
MRRTAVAWAEAQSFDRVAEDLDRLAELNRDQDDLVTTWLTGLLPAAGRRAIDLGCGPGRHAVLLAGRFEQVDAIDQSGPMIELARARRPRPNITYRQADLHDAGQAGQYDFVLSMRTLHHVPDLHAALSHVKTLLAPSGRAVVMDLYDIGPDPRWPRRLAQRVVPLRPRLHALAMLQLATNLVRRGPGTACEVYRLTTRRAWLDHRVSDVFFSRADLVRCCDELFPGYRLDILGGPRGVGLVWTAA